MDRYPRNYTKSASITPFISLFPLVLYSANSVPGVVRLSQRGGQPEFGITSPVLQKKFLPIGCDIGQEFDIQLFEGKVNGKAQVRAGNVSIHGILALQNQP